MKTITFYSYKGGVGRTLALANVAMRLSEFNKKVCIMDFDLEAPGLHHKFKQQLKTFEFKNGIVDYIHEFVANDTIPESIKDYVKVIDFNAKNKVPIDFIPAGNSQHNDYWKKLARISWKELFYEEDSEGLPFFLDLKGKIEAQLQPDFLLIDARTGLSEIAGITVSILADHVVVIAANNEENLQGAKMMLDAFSHPENVFFEKAPETTFVLSRIPYPKKPQERQRERLLLEEVRKRMEFKEDKEVLVIHSDRNLEVKESLLIAKDSDANIPVAQDYLKLFEEITKNDLTEEERKSYNNIRKAEKLVTESLESNNLKQRIDKLTEAISLNRYESLYYLYRAHAYHDMRLYNKALNDCKEALRLNEENFLVYQIQSSIYTSLIRYNEALSSIKKGLSLYEYNYFYFLLGNVYDNLQDYTNAIKSYDKYIEQEKNDFTVYNNRANVFKKIHEFQKAYNDIYKALSLSPTEGITYATLAELNAEEGNTNEYYKNIELALYFNAPLGDFLSDKVYKPYLEKPRFLKLLDKYNIEIPKSQ